MEDYPKDKVDPEVTIERYFFNIHYLKYSDK